MKSTCKIFMFSAIAQVTALLLAGCALASPATTSSAAPARAAAAVVSGPDDLDEAIREASDELNEYVPAESFIGIINIQSSSAALSDYVIDELIRNAVRDRNFTVLDRQRLEAIRQEQNFQYSGEVDDSFALEIGRLIGIQTIVTGTVNPLGSRYRFTVRALNVQTGAVQVQFNRNISAGETVVALMNSPSSAGSSTMTNTVSSASGGRAAASGSAAQEQTTPAYKIGDTGPAGGLIFYDKGNRSGGWQYLEAALVDLGPTVFATENPSRSGALGDLWRKSSDNSAREIGKGKFNTEYIMELTQSLGGGFGWAVQLCDAYEFNGFSDWFLPSRDELNFMYGNLYMRGFGDFRPEDYWSSTGFTNDWGSSFGYKMNFGDGKHELGRVADLRCRVRPVRQF